MKALSLALVSLGFTSPVAQEQAGGNDPRLVRARRAIESVGTLRFEANYRRSLQIEQETWIVDATVTLQRAKGERPAHLRVDAKLTPPERGASKREVTLLAKGAAWTFLDRGGRYYVEGAQPWLDGEASLLTFQALPSGLWSAVPFSGAEKLAFAGVESYGKDQCASFRGTSDDGSITSRWFLAESDSLPRYGERQTKLDAIETLFERYAIKNVARDPSFFRDPFALTIPEGFERREAQKEAPQRAGIAAKEVTVLSDSLAPLRDHFNAQKGRPRLVAFLAPT